MRIMITGTQGLARGVIIAAQQQGHEITAVSRSNGYNIRDVSTWAQDFQDWDACINCAYDGFYQIRVLEMFADLWKDQDQKIIVNIGSMVTDHTRSEKNQDHLYWPYRLHKQSLQEACQRMMRDRACQIKLINFGPIDTSMTKDLNVPKMSISQAGTYVMNLLSDSNLRRQDVWL